MDPPRALLALLSLVLLPLPLVGLGLLLVGIARRVLPVAMRLAGRPFHSPRGPKAAAPRSLEVTMSAPSSAPLPFPTEMPAPMAQQAAPHSAAEFTESAMLRQRARPAGRGWRRSLYAATRGAVNLGPGSDERRELELQARVSTPIRGSRRIVVISRKGGAGKTTTALMLGHTFASHRGDRVVALDANPDAGSLAHRMRRETGRTVTDLLDQRNGIERYADMRGYTSQAADTRLEVVASDDDPRISQALGEEDYRTAIDLLDRHYNLILVDTGTGILDSAIKGILAEADQIVVVMPPALDGARVAAMTLDWLEEHDHADLVRAPSPWSTPSMGAATSSWSGSTSTSWRAAPPSSTSRGTSPCRQAPTPPSATCAGRPGRRTSSSRSCRGSLVRGVCARGHTRAARRGCLMTLARLVWRPPWPCS